MTKWMVGTIGLLQLGLTWACHGGPDSPGSVDAARAACEEDPAGTCEAIARSAVIAPGSPSRYYIDAMIDACQVGGASNCRALGDWTAGSGEDPLQLFKDNCAAGSVQSCRAASVLLAEETPPVSRAFEHMARRLDVGEGCGDLLANAGSPTDGLELLSCQPSHVGQLAGLVAEYRVPARNVDAVEARLVADTGAPPIRFVCCGWESPPHVFRGKDGEHYQLVMSSTQETMDRARERMPDLKVTVAQLLELP